MKHLHLIFLLAKYCNKVLCVWKKLPVLSTEPSDSVDVVHVSEGYHDVMIVHSVSEGDHDVVLVMSLPLLGLSQPQTLSCRTFSPSVIFT